MTSAIDLHQHLWPEQLVDRLRARTHAPYLRGWTLHTRAEPPFEVDPAHHDVEGRIAADERSGVGTACVSLSAPLGIENLVRPEAAALLGAWHAGASELPDHFLAWAYVPMVDPDLDGKPVFVHPGPEVVRPLAGSLPAWWAPVVGYATQMQASWWGWQAFGGRAAFPSLRLLFGAGAGLAPVHHERLVARGGAVPSIDPHVYVDTSSYGPQALDALV